MDDESYRIDIERRLSALETNVNNLMRTAEANNKTIAALERTVSKYTVMMPILSVLLFVVGVLIGPKLG